MSNFTTYGPILHKLGYEILTIGEGKQHPTISKWTTVEITPALLNDWARAAPEGQGVGIRCGEVVAIDVDVYDEEVAQKVYDFIQSRFGCELVVRVGQAPKFLIPCRTDETIRKMYTATYSDVFGVDHRVEFLGKGQQFVAYHKHPKTQEEYFYDSAKSLHEVGVSDLPTIDADFIQELIRHFDTIIPDDWEKKHSGNAASQDNNDPFAGVATKADYTEDETISMMTTLPNDNLDYDSFLNVGMALHHQFDGSHEGFELWDNWGAKSAKNNTELNSYKWDSFGNNTSLNPVTLATVIKLSNELAVKEVKKEIVGDVPVPEEAFELKGFLTRYAYMPEDNQVLDLKRPIEYSLIKVDSFKNLTANRRTSVPAPTNADPDKEKLVPTWQLWLTNENRMTVEGTTYSPGADKRIVKARDGRLLANMAHFPEHSKTADEDLSPFLSHMSYLIPDEKQREWFMGWLAFNVQKPETRCKVTPLHVSTAHRTGRGWVVKLIESLLGVWNVSKIKMDAACGEGSKGQYDDHLHRTLVCCIEEVKATDKRYSVSDNLRDILTEPRLNVNLKYGGKATIDVFTNFFWMSNHEDAVVLPAEDKRIHVIEGPREARTKEYYDFLYQWLDEPENVASVWNYLKTIPFDDFEWTVAPDTPARDKMIEFTMTSTEDAFTTWLKNVKEDWVMFDDIRYQVGDIAQKEGIDDLMSASQLRKLLQYKCWQHPQMRLAAGKSDRGRPWYTRGNKDPEKPLNEIRGNLYVR